MEGRLRSPTLSSGVTAPPGPKDFGDRRLIEHGCRALTRPFRRRGGRLFALKVEPPKQRPFLGVMPSAGEPEKARTLAEPTSAARGRAASSLPCPTAKGWYNGGLSNAIPPGVVWTMGDRRVRSLMGREVVACAPATLVRCNMEYTTTFDGAKAICTVRVKGRLQRPDDSLVLQRLAREIGEEHNCQRFLFDMTQAEIVGGTMDIFTAGTVPADSDRRQARQRVALVYAGDLSDHKFMETVAVNRGYQLRVFDNLDEALEWLRPR